MNKYHCMLMGGLALAGCSAAESPKDGNGLGAEQFVLNTFRMMVENRYADVGDRFNEPYRKDFIEKNDGSTWKAERLYVD